MNILLDLFLTFFKIGLFTFGGGYAMISVVENICVETKKWISLDDMMNITVIAESTPGPVAINCATFVGYRKKGILGAFVATLGVVLPSLIIVCIIAMFMDDFLEVAIVANAFKGIKLGVGILIFGASINLMRQGLKTVTSYVFMIISAIAMLIIDFYAIDFSTIAMMLVAGIVGLVLYAIGGEKNRDRGTLLEPKGTSPKTNRGRGTLLKPKGTSPKQKRDRGTLLKPKGTSPKKGGDEL